MFESMCIAFFMLCDLCVERGQLSELSKGTVTGNSNVYLSPSSENKR